MFRRKSSKFLGNLLLFCSIFLTCQGTLWKTEDAYIIDDLDEPAADTTAPAIQQSSSNACTDSSGALGQCVPKPECSPFHDFFSVQNTKTASVGLQGYLNGTDGEPCTPEEEAANGNGNATEYVCCTSLQYRPAKTINLAAYLDLEDKNGDNEDRAVSELQSATSPSIDLKIVAGSPADVGEFPYAVAIISNGRQICGGSLIDSKWILSAAHCFDRFNSQAVRNLVIKVGDYNIHSGGEVAHQDHLVSKLFLHPGFFRTKGYFRDDVALIKLKTPVSPASHIRTVPLHNGNPDINSGLVQAIVCGWGKTCDGSSCPQSAVLRKAKLTIVANSQCSQRYRGTQAPPITQNMVCAGGTGNTDACNGDSGGPLVIYSGGQAHQIGIVSWGIGCGQYPGVYTRVSNFLGWINKHKQKF